MATRYWVGGSGNWTDISHWSTSSGGSGGASAPGVSPSTVADVAIIDTNSGSAGYTISLQNTSLGYVSVSSIQMNPNAMTLDLNGIKLQVGYSSSTGTLQASSNVTWANTGGTGFVQIAGNGGTLNVTNAIPSITMSANLTLQANLITSGQFNWSSGTIAFSTYTITCDNLYSGTSSSKSATKSAGGGIIYLSGSNTQIVNFVGASGFSFASTPFITLQTTGSPSTGTRYIYGISTAYFSYVVTGGSDTVSMTGYAYALNMTGFSGVVGTDSVKAYNATFPSGMTFASSGSTFTVVNTLTVNGQNFNRDVQIPVGGDVILTGNFTCNSLQNYGTLRLVGNTITAASVVCDAGGYGAFQYSYGTINTRSWTGPGVGTSSTLPGTINMSSALSKTFNGASGDYSNVTLQNSGAGALTIQSSNTLLTLSNTQYPATINFTAGTTQTITNFNVSGDSTGVVTLQSTSAGSAWTLNAGASTVRVSNVALKDATGDTSSGGAYIATSSTSLGNNTNWSFVSPGGFIAFF